MYNYFPAALHIQLRLDGLSNCATYVESETMAKASDITNKLSQAVDELCGCGFSPSLLSEEFIDCFVDSPDHVTYRAVVTGTESVSVVEIASLIEEWVSKGGSIIVQSTRLGLTSSCPVVIADRDSPECPEDITNRTFSTQPPPSTSGVATSTEAPSVAVSVVGAVAGGVVAGVLAIIVIVLVIVVIIVVVLFLRARRSGSKDISDGKTNNQQTE